ncbi:MAG: hypothetical protein ACRDRA_01240 [Pseudonocardiaceae bacterium]
MSAAATTKPSRVDGTLHLSARTVNWTYQRPLARLIVDSVWDTLTELERAGHHPGALAALRFVLIHHEPTRVGRCRACRRANWRRLWRRRRFPCLVWRQIRGELLGHLAINSHHRTGNSRNTR